MRQDSSFTARLESFLAALVAPWEFASIDAWRDHAARSAREAVGAQNSQVTLDAHCGLSVLRSLDTDPALSAEYQRRRATNARAVLRRRHTSVLRESECT